MSDPVRLARATRQLATSLDAAARRDVQVLATPARDGAVAASSVQTGDRVIDLVTGEEAIVVARGREYLLVPPA